MATSEPSDPQLLLEKDEELALKSNPVRLGSYVSRAIARWEFAGFRPGFWQQGQFEPSYSSEQRGLRGPVKEQPCPDGAEPSSDIPARSPRLEGCHTKAC